MITVKTIWLKNVADIFSNYGFFNDEVNCILAILINLWKYNDDNYDITCEYIRTEMDLDEVRAQLLINESIHLLLDPANQIRLLYRTGKLIRYNVIGSVIILEVEDAD